MPLYLCRWLNGDCSIALASNKGAAIETLDELANAEGCALTILRELIVHFRLSDSGELEFEGLGEATEEAVFEHKSTEKSPCRRTIPKLVGASASEASKIAGHGSVNMTNDYIYVQLKRQEKLTRAIGDRLGEAAQKGMNEESVAVEGDTASAMNRPAVEALMAHP